jgi:MFS family permease
MSTPRSLAAPTRRRSDDDDEQEEEEEFPWAPILAISVGLFSNSISIMMLFPFLPFMIVDLGMVTDPREPGVYSGYIGGAFMAGRIFTSFLWGRFSDVHGRKPVVVYAMISVAVFSVCFGFSINYAWALGTRFLAGATNGACAKKRLLFFLFPSTQTIILSRQARDRREES